MLQLLGVRLHPAVGVLLGIAMIAAGATVAGPMLCVVGVLVIVLTLWTRIESWRRRRASARVGNGLR